MRMRSATGVFGACLFLCIPALAADIAPPVPSAPPADDRGIWAAIAYSETDAEHGFFWGADRRDEAGEAALEHCRNAGGEACRVVAVFRNHRHWDDDDDGATPYHPCGALAVGEARAGETRPFAAETARTGAEAEGMALASCESDGRACRIRETVCT